MKKRFEVFSEWSYSKNSSKISTMSFQSFRMRLTRFISRASFRAGEISTPSSTSWSAISLTLSGSPLRIAFFRSLRLGIFVYFVTSNGLDEKIPFYLRRFRRSLRFSSSLSNTSSISGDNQNIPSFF